MNKIQIISWSKPQIKSKLKAKGTKMEVEKMETEEIELPKKRFYRQRAHSNPISDHSFE